MKLRNPGPIQPAPRLVGDAGTLAQTVQSWPGVESFTHWRLGSPGTADGAEFHVGNSELGHVHLDSTAHILLERDTATLLVDAGLGKTPSWSGSWITHPVRSTTDAIHAVWLFRLAYDRVHGVTEQELADRISAAAPA